MCDADVLVVGVPSHGFRAALEEAAPHVRPWVPIVSLTKGLEQGTRLRMTEVIDEVLPGHPTGVLAGPNLAREVVQGYAAAAAIAMPDDHVARSLQADLRGAGVPRLHQHRRDRLRARAARSRT